jgi:hypothetical protein
MGTIVRTSTVRQLAACYFLFWPAMFVVGTYFAKGLPPYWGTYWPVMFIGSFASSAWMSALPYIGWYLPFIIHAPLLLAACKIPMVRDRGVVIVSSAIGLAIGCAQWPLWNRFTGGDDPTCRPEGLFAPTCGVPPTLKLPLALSGLLTGLLVGTIYNSQRRVRATVEPADAP